MKKSVYTVSFLALCVAGAVHAEPQAEVLHYWTSGGEKEAVEVLQEEFASNGGTWCPRLSQTTCNATAHGVQHL